MNEVKADRQRSASNNEMEANEVLTLYLRSGQLLKTVAFLAVPWLATNLT